MPTADKQAAVAELTDVLQNAAAVMFTEYRGLTVAQLRQLRGALRADARCIVAKNTLTKIAAKNAGLEGLEETLSGPTAVVAVEGDLVATAKALKNFAKENDLLVIKGGHLDGKVLTSQDVDKLASLESREVVLAKLAGAAKASMAKAASLFSAPLSQAARAVAALRDKQNS